MKLNDLIYKFLNEISFAFPSDQMIAGYKLNDILKEPPLSEEVVQAIRNQVIGYLSRYTRFSRHAFFSYFLSSSDNPDPISEKELWKTRFLGELTDKFVRDFQEIQKNDIINTSLNSYLKTPFFPSTTRIRHRSNGSSSNPFLKISLARIMARSLESYKSYQSSNYSYSGSDYYPTERHTQYSSNNPSFSNDESPLASPKESVEQTLISSLSPTAESIEIIRILIARFYYLRDYHTPDDKISHVVENYGRLGNLCEKNWGSEFSPLSKVIKELSFVNYAFAKIHLEQQELKKHPSTFSYGELSKKYTVLIEKLIQYREALAKLKSISLPQNLEKDLVIHDKDVIATIHQVTKEKQFLANNINLENQGHIGVPKFRS